MPAIVTMLISTLKGILWSFFGEKIMAKLVWWFLEKAALKTTNKIDDELVADAKAVYYGEKTKEEVKNG